MTRRSGVYEIVSPSGRRYIGSTRNLKARWAVHRADLSKGRHHCRALQQAHDKYGIDNLQFRVLQECPVGMLREVEQLFIDELQPEYNSTKLVDRPSPLNRALARQHMLRLNQVPWTEERRKKAKQRLIKARAWEKNSPWTEERKEAQRERMRQRHASGRGPWTVHKERIA